MKLTRRDALTLGLGATAAALLPMSATAAAEDAIAVFTSGVEAGAGDITLSAPETVENGSRVSISVEAPEAVAIAVFATGNPTPEVATFNFGPLAGRSFASTRIRLAATQDVVAVAKLADGAFVRTSVTVKVTRSG
ncbi:thiosulfate oxidation carrier protein SoxY [Celeribacter sp.]|uniref:thiosulfate oxidation carrier protein SoxY n=1 Tax=Celeribacter sp. TaxID=1890673 RepID=UPI003A9088C1